MLYGEKFKLFLINLFCLICKRLKKELKILRDFL